jgi:GT2 family glycosyltransferase
MISVIIPTCNRLDLLTNCLQKLAPGAQMFPADQYEVIVTDDGGTNSAEQLVKEQFPWARWVAGPRKGPAANRNNGVRFAKAEFFAFTDDDCSPSPDWLSAYAAAIRPDLDVYEGKTTCRAGIRSPLDEAPVNLKGGCMWSCNLMIRAEAFRKLGGFDEDFPNAWCEDVDFFDRMHLDRVRWEFIPQATIDHPVRRQKLGWHAGAKWKNRVLLWYKQGHEMSTWRWLPVHLLKARIRQVLDFPFSLDSIVGLGSVGLEFLAVVCQLGSWERQYRPIRAEPAARQRQAMSLQHAAGPRS